MAPNPHCLNVFVPLVDVTTSNGGTEMFPCSHINWDTRIRPVIPMVKAGQAVLMDYRTKHRGLANRSSQPRAMLYFTYAKPFFADTMNFSTKRYKALPELVEWTSRNDRAARRR